MKTTSSNYQSMIWKRAQEACPSIPRPEDENGWYLNDEGILKPKLMTQEVVSSACIQLAFCGCSSEQSCLNRRCTCVRLSLPCSRACKCCDTNRCRNPENRWCWEWMKLYNVWHTEVTDMKSWSEIVSIWLYIINIVLWRKRKLTNLARSVSSREMVSTLYELSNKPFWNRISLLPRYCDKLLRIYQI